MEASTITTMSPVERRFFQEVGNACSDDVQNICSNDIFIPSPFVSLSSPLSMMMDDFGSVVDDLMRSVVESSQPQVMDTGMDTGPVAAVENSAEGDERGLESPVDNVNEETEELPIIVVRSFSTSPCEDEIVRHMLSLFLPVIAPEESTDLAHKLSEHGHVMLHRLTFEDGSDEGEETNQEARIARRLTEVTPEQVMEHRRQMFLPFSSAKNECLLSAYRDARVNTACGQALQNLEHVRAAQHHMHMYQRQVVMDTYTNLFLVYFLVFATVVVLFLRRNKLFKVRRRLASSIFTTIYSRPDLKLAVEKELGHSIGNEPPRPWKAMRTGVKKLRKLLFVLSVLFLLCGLEVISLTTALHAGVFLAAFVFVRVLLMKPNNRSEDSEAGLLTEEQCSAECGSCCGSPDEENCCDDDGCCCSDDSSPDTADEDDCSSICSENKSLTKPLLEPRHEVYEGVPIQIV